MVGRKNSMSGFESKVALERLNSFECKNCIEFMRNERLSSIGMAALVSAKFIRLVKGPLGIFLAFCCSSAIGQQPVIVTQPQSQAVSSGASFMLTASVTGAEPLTYQWQKNGRAIPNATSQFLQFGNATPVDTGSFILVVRNAYGTATTQTARVQVNAVSAQLSPISLTGWNQSVILDNSQIPFVTADFDTFGQFWFEAGWVGHEDGLPRSGQFTSQFNTNAIFQLQSYQANNVLRLDFSPDTPSGTLTLTTSAPYHSLTVLASSGNGGGSARCVLNFTDGTSISNLTYSALDWYTFSTNLAIAGLGRDHTSGTPQGYQNAVTGFGMFETDFDLRAMGLETKFLKSVTFTKASSASVTGVFAISGEPNLTVSFRSISLLTNGQVQLTLSGFPGVAYQIDSSTNLTDWVSLVVVSSPSGISRFTDSGVDKQSRMFYRANAY